MHRESSSRSSEHESLRIARNPALVKDAKKMGELRVMSGVETCFGEE